MKKLSKTLFSIISTLVVFFSITLQSGAAYCNSPCPDPCSSSRTICEGTNCTTYCDTTPVSRYGATYYTAPAVSFSYSTPNVSFSISNEVYGLHNYYTRPNIVISNGFRPIYHKNPPKPPQNFHKTPAGHKPAISHRPAPKPNLKPSKNTKPAHKPVSAHQSVKKH